MITSSLELLTAPYAFEASQVYVPRCSVDSLRVRSEVCEPEFCTY